MEGLDQPGVDRRAIERVVGETEDPRGPLVAVPGRRPVPVGRRGIAFLDATRRVAGERLEERVVVTRLYLSGEPLDFADVTTPVRRGADTDQANSSWTGSLKSAIASPLLRQLTAR